MAFGPAHDHGARFLTRFSRPRPRRAAAHGGPILDPVPSVRVEGFLPSTSGLHFANRFSRGPVFRVGFGRCALGVGDASRGLCGGMVFAARDLFEAGTVPPDSTMPPAGGTPFFRYLVRGLMRSWNLPFGPLRYVAWSALPDGDVLGRPGTRRRSLEGEWPRIRRELDAGRLAPLGLIRVRTMNPFALALNHQVLAFAYDADDAGSTTLHVYDPNHPDRDDVTLTFGPARPWPIPYGEGERPVRGLFLVPYRRPSPVPAWS
jgi:hypothetical protein